MLTALTYLRHVTLATQRTSSLLTSYLEAPRSLTVIHGSTEHTTERNTLKHYTKCDFPQLYISRTISIYDNILKLYNLHTIYNLLAEYRKINRRINRDIYMYVPDVKIKMYFIVKHQNNHVNYLKLGYIISYTKGSLYPNI
jgi:hypothetical protein